MENNPNFLPFADPFPFSISKQKLIQHNSHLPLDEPLLNPALKKHALHFTNPELQQITTSLNNSLSNNKPDLLTKTAHAEQDWDKVERNITEYIGEAAQITCQLKGVANTHIHTNLATTINLPEASSFYATMAVANNRINAALSTYLEHFITNHHELKRVMNGEQKYHTSQKKIDWARHWTDAKQRTFAERLIAYLAIENIFHLTNKLIVKTIHDKVIPIPKLLSAFETLDEEQKINSKFTSIIHEELHLPCPPTKIRDIIKTAVTIEIEYCDHVTPSLYYSDYNIDSFDIEHHIKQSANHLLKQLNQPSAYPTEKPPILMN